MAVAGIERFWWMSAMSPRDGVMPPSAKDPHTSMRVAPATWLECMHCWSEGRELDSMRRFENDDFQLLYERNEKMKK